MPVVLGDVERWLNLDTTLDDVDPLGTERFAVRAVNPAVNKVSEKKIDAPPEPLRCAAAYPAGHDDRRRPLLRRHRVVDREPRRDERPSRTAAGEDGRRRMEGGRIIQRARVDRE
jgi:hypothetical protein